MPQTALSELGQIGIAILKDGGGGIGLEDDVIATFQKATTKRGIKLTTQIDGEHLFLEVYDITKKDARESFVEDLICTTKYVERDNISLVRAESQYISSIGMVAYLYYKQNQA